MMLLAAFAAVTAPLTYLYRLSRRLDQSCFDRKTCGRPFPSDEELIEGAAKYPEINVLDDPRISTPTGKCYAVTGASGNVGAQLVKLLHIRGERNILCLDVAPLPAALTNLEGLHFHKCDVTKQEDVETIFSRCKPDVIFHICAIMRYWERRPHLHKHSAKINVDGTRHIVQAAMNLPETSDKLLVACSSATLSMGAPRLTRLTENPCFHKNTYPFSDDKPVPAHLQRTDAYASTKRAAEKIVRDADGVKGLRTGALRPGSIAGPNDLFIGYTLRQKENVAVVNSFAQQPIDTRDLSTAFLYYEHALRTRPAEVGGDALYVGQWARSDPLSAEHAFRSLVTGDPQVVTLSEMRHIIQLLAQRDLGFKAVPRLPLYLIGHAVEFYCTVRYHVWLALTGKEPKPAPDWIVKARLHALQPNMWENMCIDTEIDDSRCRKVLGYRNRYTLPQTVKWIVDTVAAEEEDRGSLYAVDDPRWSGKA